MDKIIVQLQKIISHLPGPGALIFGALVADRQSFNVLIACIVAILATNLQPPVLSLWTPALQQGLRDPGSGAPLLVGAGYLLLAVLTLVGGASGDIFGRRRFLQFGLIGVLGTNILGMFFVQSQEYLWINTLNTISSVLIMPMTIAVVTLAFPVQVRPFAYGAIFGTQGLGAVLASSIYGIFEAVDLIWAAFIPAIILGVVAIRLVRRDVQESHAPMGTSRTELAVNVLWAAGIFTLVYGVLAAGGGINERNLFLIIAICVLGFIIGYRWVARRVRRGAQFQLYNVRDLSLAILAGIMLSVGQASIFYQIGTYFQKIQGVGPVISGARLLPYIISMMIATLVIVRLAMRYDARRLISGGMIVMAIGSAALFFLQPDTPYWQLVLPFMIMGFGFGIATPARTVVVLTMPPPGLTGMAAGVNTAAGQSGFAIGVVLTSALITIFADQHFMNQLKTTNAPTAVIDALGNVYQNVFARVISGNMTVLPENLAQQVTLAFSEAFTVGLAQTYVVVGILLATTATLIFLGMNKGLKGSLIDRPPGMLAPNPGPVPETPNQAPAS